MNKFLLMLCLIVLNACSVVESEDYIPVYYGMEFAFIYGTEIEVESMTWTRSEEISTGTYIYTSTVSYTTDGFEGGYWCGDIWMTEYYESETVKFTYYMKVKEMSIGIALYSVATSYDSAKNSTSYQLYTYDITKEPYDYYISDEDAKNEYDGYSPLPNI